MSDSGETTDEHVADEKKEAGGGGRTDEEEEDGGAGETQTDSEDDGPHFHRIHEFAVEDSGDQPEYVYMVVKKDATVSQPIARVLFQDIYTRADKMTVEIVDLDMWRKLLSRGEYATVKELYEDDMYTLRHFVGLAVKDAPRNCYVPVKGVGGIVMRKLEDFRNCFRAGAAAANKTAPATPKKRKAEPLVPMVEGGINFRKPVKIRSGPAYRRASAFLDSLQRQEPDLMKDWVVEYYMKGLEEGDAQHEVVGRGPDGETSIDARETEGTFTRFVNDAHQLKHDHIQDVRAWMQRQQACRRNS